MNQRTLFLCLTLLGCIQFELTAQQYQPFPESTARWSHRYHHYWDPGTNSPKISSGFYIEMEGDTIIAGVPYNKLYAKSTWYKSVYSNPDTGESSVYTNNNSSPRNLLGALRQDTSEKKVYFHNLGSTIGCFEYEFPLNEDFLLYNFDLEVGDLHASIYGEEEVQSIDVVTLNDGIERKRFHFPFGNSMIEGVGSYRGLFGGFIENFEATCQLQCFRTEGVYVIGGISVFDCDSILVVGLEDITTSLSELKISPNPIKDIITIEGFDQSIAGYKVRLMNIWGKELTQTSVKFQTTAKIEIPDLPQGIYILSINDDSNNVVSRKLLKLE